MTPSFCPFCGNEPDKKPFHTAMNYFRYQIYCECCEYFGPGGQTPELAIAAWNERHHPYEAEINQLKKELTALKERNR